MGQERLASSGAHRGTLILAVSLNEGPWIGEKACLDLPTEVPTGLP